MKNKTNKPKKIKIRGGEARMREGGGREEERGREGGREGGRMYGGRNRKERMRGKIVM